MKMADMPEGVELIDNPVSVAPGFRIENVYVLPGVPKIMQAMLDGLLPTLQGGAKVFARDHRLAPEGDVANAGLGALQTRFPTVEIGSYPFFRPEGPGTTIVFRGTDQAAIDQARTRAPRPAAGRADPRPHVRGGAHRLAHRAPRRSRHSGRSVDHPGRRPSGWRQAVPWTSSITPSIAASLPELAAVLAARRPKVRIGVTLPGGC